jgi:hypothetical protein
MKTLLLHLSKERDILAQKRRNIESLRTAMSSSSNEQGGTESMEDLEASFKDYWNRIIKKYQSSMYLNGEKDSGSTKGNHTLEWMFSITGITQTKEGTLSSTEGGVDDMSGNVEEKKKPRHSKRMTILPAPPLPTVAAHHSTHTEMMQRLQAEVTNLRTGLVESADLAGRGDSKRENKIGDGVFTSFMDEETNLTGLIGRFHEELEELDLILETELGKKREDVAVLYEQQQELFGGHEQERRYVSLVDQFELNYEVGWVIVSWFYSQRTNRGSDRCQSLLGNFLPFYKSRMGQMITQVGYKTFETLYIGIYSPLNLLKRRKKIYWMLMRRWRWK